MTEGWWTVMTWRSTLAAFERWSLDGESCAKWHLGGLRELLMVGLWGGGGRRRRRLGGQQAVCAWRSLGSLLRVGRRRVVWIQNRTSFCDLYVQLGGALEVDAVENLRTDSDIRQIHSKRTEIQNHPHILTVRRYFLHTILWPYILDNDTTNLSIITKEETLPAKCEPVYSQVQETILGSTGKV